MTIEARIDELTAAITALTAAITARAGAAVAVPVHQPVHQPVHDAAPVAAVPAPAMPAPPVFAAPVVLDAPTVPFSDPKGLMDYVMSTYKALGPAKGAEIQKVLAGLGVGTINEIKSEQYAALYAGIEALK